MARVKRPFLTATWRNLVLLTYEIDPEVLQNYVPQGLSLDLWQGKCLVSLVGLQFLKTKVMGIPAPVFHSYPEVNLRFYVGREVAGQRRRGVVFIKQIVPYGLVALVARRVYHERFVAMPVRFSAETNGPDGLPNRIRYDWRNEQSWEHLEISDLGDASFPEEGSIEGFVAEHYWGYNTQPDGSTLEYMVARPSWRIRTAEAYSLACAAKQLYGSAFVDSLNNPPLSAFWAEGSEVAVHRGVKVQ